MAADLSQQDDIMATDIPEIAAASVLGPKGEVPAGSTIVKGYVRVNVWRGCQRDF